MKVSHRPMKIAALQMTSVLDPEKNLPVLNRLLAEASKEEVKAVFLPECFYSMSNGEKATPYLVEEGNEHYLNIKNLAKKHGLYLLGGSVAYKCKGKIFNRNLNFNPRGEELNHYDKINLFSCDLSRMNSKKVMDESDIYSHGAKPLLLEIENLKIGMSICFDLRFPEMFRAYSAQGAHLLSISSAFTIPTGKVHWHTLLQARAIENQCYVVAAAQEGVHNEKISTFGHSLIVDPWGKIVANAEKGEKIVTFSLDMEYLSEVRRRILVRQKN